MNTFARRCLRDQLQTRRHVAQRRSQRPPVTDIVEMVALLSCMGTAQKSQTSPEPLKVAPATSASEVQRYLERPQRQLFCILLRLHVHM